MGDVRAKATLADIARHAGVSRSTVSLVIRDAGAISETTRERVRASIEALGYVYHRGAASLRGRSTGTVAFILPDVAAGSWSEMSQGLEQGLTEAGVVTLMLSSFESAQRQEVLFQSVLERQVDGVILTPAIDTPHEFIDRVKRSRIPIVLANRDLRGSGLPFVGFNNRAGGRLAGGHLVTHHVRAVAYLGGRPGLGVRNDRVAGVKKALRDSPDGAELVADIPGPAKGSWGYETMKSLLKSGQHLDAVVCHSDMIAFGAYRAAARHWGSRAGTIRIVSFENLPSGRFWDPPLTSVAATDDRVGRTVAETLLAHINDPARPAERILLQPEMFVRKSCGCEMDDLDLHDVAAL